MRYPRRQGSLLDPSWSPSPTSGCQRRRRKAILRRQWINDLMVKHQYRQRVMLGVPHE